MQQQQRFYLRFRRGLAWLLLIALGWGLTQPALAATPGTVVAWGYNGAGQSSVPAGLSGVTAIAGGGYHSLALKSDGTVVAWGDNTFGQSSVPAGLSGVTAIAGGSYHSLALKSDGTVVAWGANFFSQSSVPAGLGDVTAIAVGAFHSLALKGDGTVVAWGCGGGVDVGQCSVPAGLDDVTAIAAGRLHSLAIRSDTTPPVAQPSQSPVTNAAGWNNSDVTITWNWTDNAGGRGINPANCTTSTLVSDQGELTLNATCVDLAGNSGSASYSLKVDKTKPLISAAPTSTPNANGWYNSDVTIHFTCADGLSGVATCPADQVLSSEGGAVASLAQTSSDLAGNTSDPSNVVTIQLDKTAPVVAVTGVTNGASYPLGGVPAAGCSTSDALSGVATQATLAVTGGNPDGTGSFTATCSGATDLAGNPQAAPVAVAYTVNPQPPPPQNLRQQVQAVRSSLAALLPSGNSKTDKSLTKALSKLDQALADNLWQADGNHLTLIGDDVFNRLQDAVKELTKIKNPSTGSGQAPAPTVRTALTTLTTICRTLAQTALDEAIAAQGDPNKIRKAQSKLSKGDGEAAKGKLDKAIAQYEDAWEYAQQALGLPVASSLPAEEQAEVSDEESSAPAAEEGAAVAGATQRIFLPQINR